MEAARLRSFARATAFRVPTTLSAAVALLVGAAMS